MKITEKDVLHTATLAHLHLKQEELAQTAEDLKNILTCFNKLQDLDTHDIAPFEHPKEKDNTGGSPRVIARHDAFADDKEQGEAGGVGQSHQIASHVLAVHLKLVGFQQDHHSGDTRQETEGLHPGEFFLS